MTDDIAEMIERLEHPTWLHGSDHASARLEADVTRTDLKEAAATLRTLAQENERQKESLLIHAREIQLLFERIRELKADRDAVIKDAIKAALAWKAESATACDAACDAIWAKAIEECAKVVISWQGKDDPLVAAIRALAQSMRKTEAR
jgi:hypothetical protein